LLIFSLPLFITLRKNLLSPELVLLMSYPEIAYGVVPSAVAARRGGLAFLQSVIARAHPDAPLTETTSIALKHAESGRVIFEGTPSGHFFNFLGTIHGGWISTLLDSAMGCAVHSVLPPGFSYTTVDMSVTFVRAVLPSSGVLTCEGKIIHQGRRIATAEGRIVDAKGKLIAHGNETCMILEAPFDDATHQNQH
jgi:uncharacterized protein (TIGR00369 family)